MTLQGFLSLAVQTVTAPREVARLLLSLRLSQEALLTAFALVVVANTLVFSTSLLLSPSVEQAGFLGSPSVFLAMQAAVLGATVVAVHACGRALGGVASAADVALLLIWMQALRVLVQVGLLVILPLSPLLGGVVMMLATAAGIWILINFIDEVHEFGNMGRAAFTLILAVVGMALALSFLLTLAGVNPAAVQPAI